MKISHTAILLVFPMTMAVVPACSGNSPSHDETNGRTGTGGASNGGSGPAAGGSSYVPSDCGNATAHGYSILQDSNYDAYQIRKVGAVTFKRYESDGAGNQVLMSEDYSVVTAFPKKYLLSVVHQGKQFPTEDRGDYYVVDSQFALPNIDCVTDDVIYAPIVAGKSEPTVTERGPNLGWPIHENIADEVAKYQTQDKEKMWVYTTWPGYRYGYWFRDSVGIRPTWLFHADKSTGEVKFRKFTPDAQDWPEGAYNDVPYGLHIDTNGKVYVPKRQPITFPTADNQPPPPTELKLAYKNWDDELRCVVINKSSAIVAVSRTIWPGGSEAYYPAESFLPGYAVIGEDADRYWGLKGRETDAAAWWAGDDCVNGACSGQSRMPYRNGCSIDGYDFGQGDGFNWLALKDRMIQLGVIINREQMYRIQIYLQKNPDEPANMMAELWYEQQADGRWLPRLTPGTNTYNITQGDNPRYIVNGHIWTGQRVFAVIRDL
jgi:hypothetical protein